VDKAKILVKKFERKHQDNYQQPDSDYLVSFLPGFYNPKEDIAAKIPKYLQEDPDV